MIPRVITLWLQGWLHLGCGSNQLHQTACLHSEASGVWNEAQSKYPGEGGLGCSQGHSQIPGAYYKDSLDFKDWLFILKGSPGEGCKGSGSQTDLCKMASHVLFVLFWHRAHQRGIQLPPGVSYPRIFTRGNRTLLARMGFLLSKES